MINTLNVTDTDSGRSARYHYYKKWQSDKLNNGFKKLVLIVPDELAIEIKMLRKYWKLRHQEQYKKGVN